MTDTTKELDLQAHGVTCEYTRYIEGDAMLVFQYSGQGIRGEYDPEGKNDDYPCMVLSAYRYVQQGDGGRWELLDKGTVVTLFDARAVEEEQVQALRWLMQRLYYSIRVNEVSPLIHSLAWIEREWLDNPPVAA